MRVALARVQTALYDELPDEALLAKVGWHESCMHVTLVLSLYTRHLPVYNVRLCLVWQTLGVMAIQRVLISLKPSRDLGLPACVCWAPNARNVLVAVVQGSELTCRDAAAATAGRDDRQ